MTKQQAKKQENMAEIMGALKPTSTVESARFGLARHARNIFYYHAKPGSEIADYMVPEFWLPEAAKLHPLCRIEIVEESGEWFAEVLVRSIGSQGVGLLLLTYTKIGGVSAPGARPTLADGLRVVYIGTHSKWCCFKGEKLLVDGLSTESDAVTWIEENSRGAAA